DMVRVARRLRRDSGRHRAPRRRARRSRGLLRSADEHVVPARRLCLEQPGTVHDGRRADARVEGRRLLRPRPLPTPAARDTVACEGLPGIDPEARCRCSLKRPPAENDPGHAARVVRLSAVRLTTPSALLGSAAMTDRAWDYVILG